MVLIEKLKTTNPLPQIGLVDLLHKDNTLGQNMLGLYPSTHLLKPFIESQLNGIAVGSKYGTTGIDINILLLEKPNFIVETTFRDLKSLPYTKQVRLLKEHTIILTDLEEGGAFYGHLDECLISYLKKLNVIPKKIISVTSGFNQISNSSLNIHCVYLPIWPVFAILANDFYVKLVFDQQFKNNQRSLLSTNIKKFGIFPNKKPRPHRVTLLAELEHRNILNKFDWSLLYSEKPLGDENDYGNFIKSPNNFRFNSTIKEHTNIKIEKFLKNHQLPKLFTDSKHNVYGDCLGPAESWFGKYNYYISAETYIHPHPTSFGNVGFLTEKTFKAFCIGSKPFIMGLPGSEEQLRKLGFKVEDQGFDNLSGIERSNSICDILERLSTTTKCDNSYELYNFDLITDPTFLAKLITDAIKKIML